MLNGERFEIEIALGAHAPRIMRASRAQAKEIARAWEEGKRCCIEMQNGTVCCYDMQGGTTLIIKSRQADSDTAAFTLVKGVRVQDADEARFGANASMFNP